MTVCGHNLIQQPKKPLYSAKGPSCRSNNPVACSAFLYCFLLSFMRRTLMVSTISRKQQLTIVQYGLK